LGPLPHSSLHILLSTNRWCSVGSTNTFVSGRPQPHL
jgi:hypothetical protein